MTRVPVAYRPEHTAAADAIYTRLVSEAGLYGVAFFGHGPASARAKLPSLWQRAMREASAPVVSPFVRRAQAGTLPASDRTAGQ